MRKFRLFKKISKKRDRLEVTTNNDHVQFNDGISLITPLTGLPPEDHPNLNHLHTLGMDTLQSTGVNNLYLYDIACHSDDEMSAITSTVPSPKKDVDTALQQKLILAVEHKMHSLTDKATGVSFNPKLDDMYLVGVGVHKKSIIKVYSVAMYATSSVIRSISTFAKGHKDAHKMLRSAARSFVSSQTCFVLNMMYKVDGKSIASDIVDGVKSRYNGHVANIIKLESLICDGVKTKVGYATKGTILRFDCSAQGVSVSIDGTKQGNVLCTSMGSAFVDMFMDDQSVSPRLIDNCLETWCESGLDTSDEEEITARKISFGHTAELGMIKMRQSSLPGVDDDSDDIIVYEDSNFESGQHSGLPRSTRSSDDIRCELKRGDRMMTREKHYSAQRLDEEIKKNTSWLTRSKYFQQVVDTCFDMVDTSKSGHIALDEVYTGLLLIHPKLTAYLGLPACWPANREYIRGVLHLLKSDVDDTLNREEFAVVMKILYSDALTRIVVRWTLTLTIVLKLSEYIIEHITLLASIAHEIWRNIYDALDPIQQPLYKLWLCILRISPDWFDSAGITLIKSLQMVLWASWEGMPRLILNSILTFVVVPYALNHIEDLFRKGVHTINTSEKTKEI